MIGARRDEKLNEVAEDIISDGGVVRVLAGDVLSQDYNKALVDLAREDWDLSSNTNLTCAYLVAAAGMFSEYVGSCQKKFLQYISLSYVKILLKSQVVGAELPTHQPAFSRYAIGKNGCTACVRLRIK